MSKDPGCEARPNPKPCPPKPSCPPCQPHPRPCPPTYSGGPGKVPKKMGKLGCIFSLLKTGIIFGAGVYTGVYIAQNYQLDKVEDPKALAEKLTNFIKSKTEGGK